jgi:hypothetical protein
MHSQWQRIQPAMTGCGGAGHLFPARPDHPPALGGEERPFIQTHNMQALVMGSSKSFCGSSSAGLLPHLRTPPALGRNALLGLPGLPGKMVNIPVVSNMVKGQG